MHGNKASESLCIIQLDAGSNLQQIIEIMEGGRVSQEPPSSPDLWLHRSESCGREGACLTPRHRGSLVQSAEMTRGHLSLEQPFLLVQSSMPLVRLALC